MFNTDLNNIKCEGKIKTEGDIKTLSDGNLTFRGVSISANKIANWVKGDLSILGTRYKVTTIEDEQGNVIEKREYINIEHYPSEIISEKELNMTLTKDCVIENLALVSGDNMILTVCGNVKCSKVLIKAKSIKISSLEPGADLTINNCAINGSAINDNYNITPEHDVTITGDANPCVIM